MSLKTHQSDDVALARAQSFTTRRPTVAALEDMLYEPQFVLDHGFIRVVDYMGDDAAIVQAARVSYGQGTKKVNEDRGLINYLMRHSHTTPFEMCEIKLHVKLPIFIARQWIRHRTANVNEYSARYSIMEHEFYLPKAEHLAVQSAQNRQGRGETLPPEHAAQVLTLLKNDAETCYNHYTDMLNQTEDGTVIDPSKDCLARELARMNLTLNFYTQWYWKIDLHNLFHFMALRADSHAQYEIRAYADVLMKIAQAWVPMAFDAFTEYRLHGQRFSRSGLDVVQRMLRGEIVTHESSGMSPREWRELMEALGRSS